MEIEFRELSNLKINEDWYPEVTPYGEYVAFNGDEQFAEIVKRILLDPDSYYMHNEFKEYEKVILENYRTVKKSFRKAANGNQYDWYIKYFHVRADEKGKKDFIIFNNKVFAIAVIFNTLISMNFFDIDSILENLPILRKKYKFQFEKDRTVIKITKLDARGDQANIISEVGVLKDEIRSIKEMLENIQNQSSSSREVDLKEYTSQIRELKTSLKNKLEKISQLESELNSNSEINEEIENKNLILQQEIGKLKTLINEKNSSIITFFESVFPRLSLLSDIVITKIVNSRDREIFMKKIKEINEHLIEKGKDISDLNSCTKLEGLKYWYRVNVSKKDLNQSRSGFSQDIYGDWIWEGGVEECWQHKDIGYLYICVFEKHGNMNIFIHSDEDESNLEYHDPPRTESVIGGRLS